MDAGRRFRHLLPVSSAVSKGVAGLFWGRKTDLAGKNFSLESSNKRKQSASMVLYRALRPDEIAAGNILIPKSADSFLAHPRLPITLPFKLGERAEHAVREHQWNSKYMTRGVSCTREWAVALRYAGSSIIVTIDESGCERLGIKRYRVKDVLPLQDIEHPEDEEVILVSDFDGPLPKEIISAVHVL